MLCLLYILMREENLRAIKELIKESSNIHVNWENIAAVSKMCETEDSIMLSIVTAGGAACSLALNKKTKYGLILTEPAHR